MKKQWLCLLLVCTLLACGCVSGEDTLSGFESSGNSFDTSFEASYDTSSDTSSAETETPLIETDFFTANGQDPLPDTASLPALAQATDTAHLYTLPIALPEAIYTIESLEFVGKTVQMCCTRLIGEELTETLYCVYSAETGELLVEKQLPIGSFCGPLADGGFWYGAAEGISLTICGKDGTETVLRQASDAYSGIRAPHLLALTQDGNTLLAAFGTDVPFLLFDLRTGVRTRITADVRTQNWTLLETEEDAFLLAGSHGALVSLSISEAAAEVLPKGDPVCGVTGDLLRLSNVEQGVVLRGQAPDGSGTRLLLADFLTEEERLSAQAFGCCATVSFDGSVRFYDLREEICVSSFALNFPSAVFLQENGLALLSDGLTCFVYDLPAAYADRDLSAGEPIDVTLVETDTLDAYFSQLVKEMEDAYGITLYIGSEGNDFAIEGYVGRAELDPVAIYNALTLTDEILSRYPEGMLREAYEGMYDSLRLYLCSELYGYASDGLARAGGLTAFDTEELLVAIDIHNGLETTLPHELSHVFDARIRAVSARGESDWMQLWEDLHPFNNAYLYSYENYWSAQSYTYPNESVPSRVWFVDDYSRSFPTEDRARIIENLFNPVDGALPEALQSPHLLEKARFYSYILRQCFASCAESSQPLFWETYLGTIDENAVASFLPAA